MSNGSTTGAQRGPEPTEFGTWGDEFQTSLASHGAPVPAMFHDDDIGGHVSGGSVPCLRAGRASRSPVRPVSSGTPTNQLRPRALPQCLSGRANATSG